jgi:hypothetical protein
MTTSSASISSPSGIAENQKEPYPRGCGSLVLLGGSWGFAICGIAYAHIES